MRMTQSDCAMGVMMKCNIHKIVVGFGVVAIAAICCMGFYRPRTVNCSTLTPTPAFDPVTFGRWNTGGGCSGANPYPWEQVTFHAYDYDVETTGYLCDKPAVVTWTPPQGVPFCGPSPTITQPTPFCHEP